jgi:hypothetical protein
MIRVAVMAEQNRGPSKDHAQVEEQVRIFGRALETKTTAWIDKKVIRGKTTDDVQ